MLYNLYTFNMNAYNSKFIRHQNQLLFKLADLQQEYSYNPQLHSFYMYEQIISFLNKYTITRIDSQTSVITQVLHLPSSSSTLQSYEDVSAIPFANQDGNSKDHNAANLSTKTPISFLIKDLIIPQNLGGNIDYNGNNVGNDNNKQNQKMLSSILQTLSHHQQLNNKYILTLIHYQMFITNIPYTNHNGIQSNLQTQRNNNNPSYNANYKPNYSNNTYEEQNSRIFNSKLQSEVHSQYTVKNQVNDNQNDDESLNNSNSIYQYNYDQSDSVMEQNKNQEYPKFSKLINAANMKKTNILNSSHAYNNTCKDNFNHVNINVNINQNNKNNINNISNGNVNIYNHGPHNAIRAIYQYGSLTLKQQIVNRIASSTQFEQQQLWAILATLVQALSYLQEEEIAYGVLGTDKIFINNSLVKVLDPSATASDPLLISQGRLYSPQILNDQQNIDIFKSDVYIIGLILLECGLLIDLSKDIQPNLQKYKAVFKQQYSKQLLDVIEKCLNNEPNNRPTFTELKEEIGKQLNWVDFSNNYENANNKVLECMNNDKQDESNPIVEQIQLEYEQCNYDILYENLNKEQIKKYQKIYLTQYQRAKLKYLGNDICIKLSNQNSRNQEQLYLKNGQICQEQSHRSQRIKNRHNSSLSPMETRKNGKYNSVKHYDSQNNSIYLQKQSTIKATVPNLNMAISQSVYTDGSMTSTTKHRYKQIKKPYKKYQRQNKQQAKKQNKQQQQCTNYQEGNNCNQKIKKTKLIKDKLVKNNIENDQQMYQDNNNIVQQNKNVQHPHFTHNTHAIRQPQSKDNKYGQSIQQQLYQQSESSYLYYNNNNINSQPVQKQNQNSKGSSIGDSHVSEKNNQNKNTLQSSQNNLRHSGTTMLKNAGMNNRKSTNLQNISEYKQKYFTINTNKMEMSQNNNLFTHPDLLKTIQDDLARISTKKCLQNGMNNIKENRYGK